MKIATVGVHVLDTHVIGIESIPGGSDGQLVETIRMSAAGTAGGTALVLSRIGAEVLSFGAVGSDPIGDTLLALLAREGVDTSGLVRKDDQQTSASVIPVRPNGDRPAWHCIGANGAFTLDDLDRAALDGITHLHLGGPEFLGGEAAGELLAHARSIGATTSLDVLAPGDPDMLAWIAGALPHTDYLLPNDEQVFGFTGASSLADGARALVDAGAGCVAVTQGAKGALVVTADEVIEVPAYPIEPDRLVDTTGCGDAFSAGFLRGLSLGRDLRAAARLGCATAAQVAQGLGTDAGSYDLDTVVALAG
ncbi:sugar kinase [Nocardioides caricicola]|uniref:Sugar kinase n=1 Tax=Nocardioides caricicola TaxID=634770 RepID=A0ABW0MUZ5_9ACTN